MAKELSGTSTHECLFVDFLSEEEPKKVFEALKHPGWVDTMQEELNQFARKKVWTLVPTPYGKIIIGSKWVFRNKRDETCIVIKNKERLVAQGYNQQEGIDYGETFSPIVRLEAIKIFLAFSTYMNFIVYQIDVKSAFQNGNLKKEVYVKQPPGFESSEFPNHVCKLYKALYELKQAPRAWYETLSTFFTKHKFERGTIDNLDSGLTVLVFKQGDDLIDAINHMMPFLSVVVTSRFPTTNNQLRNSSNPRQQATINDGRVTVQPCTQLKKKRDDSWFKDKVLLVQAKANGQILHEEELAFLAYLGIPEDALVEVHNPDNMHNSMINQVVQVMLCSEQSNVMNQSETEITSDSNIIPYSQYVIESQQVVVQNSKTYAQQDALILSVIEQLKTHVINCTMINLDNKIVNDTLTAELERYKEQVKMLKKGQNVENSMNSSDLTPSNRPTKVEVPKELSKVSMVNTSLKKLKHHLAGFDVVVKERTIATAIAEGTWGFEHTKAFLNENERLLEQIITKDIMNIVGNSSVDNATVNMHECKECLKLETELHNKKDFIEKETYDKLFRRYTMLEKHCISLELDTQLNQEIFQRENSVTNQSAPSFDQYFELNELKAQSQENDTFISKLKERIKSLSGNIDKDKVKKDIEEIETINIELDHRVSKLIAENEHLKQTYKQLYDSIKSTRVRSKEQCLIIAALKDELRKLKRKAIVDNTVTTHTIDPEMLKVDVEPIALRLMNNRTVHSDYLRLTQEQVAILREVVGQGKSQNPLNNSLDHAYLKDLQHSKLNANSKLICVKCNGCMLSDNHDLCVPNFINDVNARAKSKSVKKNSNRKVWKPKGKVFTKIGYIWRPTGRTFTIVENACPLTRITTTTEVPSRKPIALETDTPKHVVTLVFSRKPIKSKTTDHVRKSEVIKSISANKKEHESGCSKHMTGDRSQLTNFVNKFLGTVKFRNDHVGKIMGYRDYQTGNVMISRVYYVEGLGHNLFFVGQFCDSNLEVAFCQHTCYIHNIEGVDLLIGSRGNDLYTLSLADMIASGLLPNPSSSTPFVPPSRTDWDLLFQPLFDELLTPSPSVDHPAPKVIASITKVVAPKPAASTGSPSQELLTKMHHHQKGAVDLTLFIRKVRNDLLLVQIYVDDIIFASTNTAMCNEFSNLMTTKFKMSMLGQNDSVDTPSVEKSKRDEDLQGKPVDATLYHGMIGYLMYLTSSRPDLTYVVCLCARYQTKPTKKHLNVVK
nr:retrovirus-related Pol polyprotein from transposon TNT 1-94 [Tanacetum cinerariifolium]